MHRIPMIIFVIYAACTLLAVVVLTGFVLWDRRANGTPWNLFSFGTRVVLVGAFWPVLLMARFGIWLEDFRGRNPRRGGDA